MIVAELGCGIGITHGISFMGHHTEWLVYLKYIRISMTSSNLKIILKWGSCHCLKILFSFGIVQPTKAWWRCQREVCFFLVRIYIYLALPAPPEASYPSPDPSQAGWLKGALGPLKAAAVNSFGWGFDHCLFFLFSVKMNCQYVLYPDNHLVETQKKLQNRMEVISLKWLVGASKVNVEKLDSMAPLRSEPGGGSARVTCPAGLCTHCEITKSLSVHGSLWFGFHHWSQRLGSLR